MSNRSLSHPNMSYLDLFSAFAGENLFSNTRLRPPAITGLDVHRGLRGQQQLGVLREAMRCCPVQRRLTSDAAVGGTTRQLPPAAPSVGGTPSSRAGAGHHVHVRALRQEKGDDRRAVARYCQMQRGAAVSRPRVKELVEAAPVAAQVAPHRRQVAIDRRSGDVWISGWRHSAEISSQKFILR